MGGGATAGAGGPEPTPERGWVAPRVAEELPGLGLSWVEAECRPGRSPESVRRRLRELSDRFYGSHAVHLRERPVPWAYRVFFRHIGLDPDRERTPVERLALERLQHGAFRSAGLPEDALTIATAETGVALCAFDADRLAGPLGVRSTAPGESLGEGAKELVAGTLAIADESGPLAVLFGAAAASRLVGKGTRRVAVVATRVENVPEIAVDEALWIAASALAA